MGVPKCKECSCFNIIPPKQWYNKNNSYECLKVTIAITTYASISSKDIRTSPKWCPKRNQEVKNGI